MRIVQQKLGGDWTSITSEIPDAEEMIKGLRKVNPGTEFRVRPEPETLPDEVEITVEIPGHDAMKFFVDPENYEQNDDSTFTRPDVLLEFNQAYELLKAWIPARAVELGRELSHVAVGGSDSALPTFIIAETKDGKITFDDWAPRRETWPQLYSLRDLGSSVQWSGPKESLADFVDSHTPDAMMMMAARASYQEVAREISEATEDAVMSHRIVIAQTLADFIVAYIKEFDVEVPEGLRIYLITEITKPEEKLED